MALIRIVTRITLFAALFASLPAFALGTAEQQQTYLAQVIPGLLAQRGDDFVFEKSSIKLSKCSGVLHSIARVMNSIDGGTYECRMVGFEVTDHAGNRYSGELELSEETHHRTIFHSRYLKVPSPLGWIDNGVQTLLDSASGKHFYIGYRFANKAPVPPNDVKDLLELRLLSPAPVDVSSESKRVPFGDEIADPQSTVPPLATPVF